MPHDSNNIFGLSPQPRFELRNALGEGVMVDGEPFEGRPLGENGELDDSLDGGSLSPFGAVIFLERDIWFGGGCDAIEHSVGCLTGSFEG